MTTRRYRYALLGVTFAMLLGFVGAAAYGDTMRMPREDPGVVAQNRIMLDEVEKPYQTWLAIFTATYQASPEFEAALKKVQAGETALARAQGTVKADLQRTEDYKALARRIKEEVAAFEAARRTGGADEKKLESLVNTVAFTENEMKVMTDRAIAANPDCVQHQAALEAALPALYALKFAMPAAMAKDAKLMALKAARDEVRTEINHYLDNLAVEQRTYAEGPPEELGSLTREADRRYAVLGRSMRLTPAEPRDLIARSKAAAAMKNYIEAFDLANQAMEMMQ